MKMTFIRFAIGGLRTYTEFFVCFVLRHINHKASFNAGLTEVLIKGLEDSEIRGRAETI